MQGSPDLGATRRTFLGAATAASYQRVLGANDRVQLGFVGYGLIGARHVADFKKQPDADLAAVCDVYQPRVEQGVAACGGRAKSFRDFRKLLDDKDIQAVVVATPDHWHALLTIMACAAGKDVYVEKPLTVFVKEGRWMTTAARRYKRVVQTGTQQRSGKHFQEAVRLIRDGYLGKVHSSRIGSFRNITPGFGVTAPERPPSDLDYDLWLGPAPLRPYTRHRALYHFRWFWDYSGGQMTNLGTHNLDIVHWAMQVKGPRGVSCAGGRYALSEDDGETPDTQDAILEYPGFTVVISIREACGGRVAGGGGFQFYGTKASMTVSRGGFEIIPEMKVPPENLIPAWSAPSGHPARSKAAPEPWTQPLKMQGSSDEQMDLHKRNWLDCIKSRRQPVADVEEGHQVATACHLANIAMRVGRRIQWDPDKEEIINDREASAMLVRPYRKPWDEVLRSYKL
ncbi:MAG: Gfo/Idh/MocA family oxidoreductase [Bryobacterales bacterium]|nr:Gfo/Idh/MocA family oxidoreductase [Bryobacterales bacterium]